MVLRKRYARYDAILETMSCSAGTNFDLTLEMRMGFRPISPAAGANTGTCNDYGSASGPARQIVKCSATGNTNDTPCYGTSDQDKKSVMGGGMRLDAMHGAAWLGAFNDFAAAQPQSPIYTPPPGKRRAARLLMRRAYPRSVAEFEADTLVTKLLPGR